MDKAYFLIQYNKCYDDVDDPGYRIVNKESVLPGIDPLNVEVGQVVTFFGFDNHPFITAKVLQTSDREVELHKALSQIIWKQEGKKRRRAAKYPPRGKENVDTDILQMVLDIDEAMKILQETSVVLENSMKKFQETHDLVKRKTGRIKFLHNQQNKLSSGNCACNKYPTIAGLPPGFEIVYRGTDARNSPDSKRQNLDDREDDSDYSMDSENESEADFPEDQNVDEVEIENVNEPSPLENMDAESFEACDVTPKVDESSIERREITGVQGDGSLPDKIYTETTFSRRKRKLEHEDEYNLAQKRELRKRFNSTENDSPDALEKSKRLTGIIKKRSLDPKNNVETEVPEKKVLQSEKTSNTESSKTEKMRPEPKKVNARKSLYRTATRRCSLDSRDDEDSDTVESTPTQEVTLLTDVKGRRILRRDSKVGSDSVEIILQETGEKKTNKESSCETLSSKIKQSEKDDGASGNTKIMLEDSVELEFIRIQSSSDLEKENKDKDSLVDSANENENLDKADEQKDNEPVTSEESNMNNSTSENDNVTSTNIGNAEETNNDDSTVEKSYIDVNVLNTNDNDTSLSSTDGNLDSSKPADVEENYVKPIDLLPQEILTLSNATEILNDKSSYVKIKPSEMSVKAHENKDTYSWTLKFSGPIEGKTVQILNGFNVYLAKESLLAASTASNLDDLCKTLLESIYNTDALKDCGLLRHKAKGIKYRLHPKALTSIIIFVKLVAKIKQWDADLSEKAITNSIRSKLKQIQQT